MADEPDPRELDPQEDPPPGDAPCPKCEGSGLNPARSRFCSACLGSGKKRERPYGWQ